MEAILWRRQRFFFYGYSGVVLIPGVTSHIYLCILNLFSQDRSSQGREESCICIKWKIFDQNFYKIALCIDG
jgi:hypothetical protein